MSEFYPRNKWNSELSDAKFNWFKKKAYLREKASVLSNGTREDTARIAQLLIDEEYIKYMENKLKDKNTMTDEELDRLVDDVMNGGNNEAI